ncbi:MAG: SdrD B-like domain-containing protein, partial [Saprospiraceae bacterium]
SPGDAIDYTFVVTNTGNVTLGNVMVSDPLFGLSFGPVDLAPNSSDVFTYTYHVTQNDIDAGSVYNLASVSSLDPNDDPIEDDDDETITAVQNPVINLQKLALPLTYESPGDIINYTFIVTNAGNVTLTNVIVTDPLFGLNFGPVSLLPSASQTYTYAYSVTQQSIDIGQIYNEAQAVGVDPNNTTITDNAEVTVHAIQNPSIVLYKEGVFNDENSDGFAQPGETITFLFLAMNNGNVTLYNVDINDPSIGVFNLPVLNPTLEPGRASSVAVQYSITTLDIDNSGIYNEASTTGTTENNVPVSNASKDPTPLDPDDPNYNGDCPDCTFVNLSKPSSISNFVWHDLNGDGLQNLGEPGIPNVYVNLYSEDGVFVGSQLTNALGNYIFPVVFPGRYQLRFEIPSSFTPTFKDRINDNIDSDINQEGLTDVFTLGSEENRTNLDAGFYQCASIGELIWYDSNKNDIADLVENGINGLQVQLWKNHFGAWTLWTQTSTGHKPGTPSDDGYWKFCAPPGEYYIKIIMPPLGLVRARPNIGGNPLKDSDLTNANGILTTNTFYLNSGQNKLDLAGGFYPMATAGNLVWFDTNANGIQESTEGAVEGVEVSAHDIQTGNLLRNVTTDHNGFYEMDYLEKRDIYFKFALPDHLDNYGPTLFRVGTDDTDSDVDGSYGSMTTRSFSMLSGMVNENIDLGIVFGVLPITWGNLFALKVSDGHLIRWSTKQEHNSKHFIVERKLVNELTFSKLSPDLAAGGNTQVETWYEFTDHMTHSPGLYLYRIRQVDLDGKELLSREVSLQVEKEWKIDVYPNPTVHEATIDLELDADYKVSISLFDNEGRWIKDILSNKLMEKGSHKNTFVTSQLANGMYNLSFQIGEYKTERRIVKIAR